MRSANAATSSARCTSSRWSSADTAGAAREVAEAGDVTRAALATKLAAKIYGLRILKKDVADAKHNTTRFVVLARKPKWASRKEKRVMTTFVFQVRNIPAALYKALGGFATNGINMTKLESYMVDGNFAATQFYADVQGHPKDRALELALEELEFVSQPKTLRILGVYPNASVPGQESFRKISGNQGMVTSDGQGGKRR